MSSNHNNLPSPPLFTWSECNPAEAPPNEYLAEGLIRQRGTNLVLSAPKQGKSQLLAHIVACLLTGKPVFGKYSVDDGKPRILFIITEETRFKVRSRIEANLRGLGLSPWEIEDLAPQIEDRLKISARDKNPERMIEDVVFSVERHDDWLLQGVSQGEYNVVLLDSLRPAHGFDENSSTEMRPVTDLMRELAGYGCGLLVHHTPHSFPGFNRTGGDAARGSSDLDAARDTAIHLQGGSFGKLLLLGVHHRDDAERFIVVQTKINEESNVIRWEFIGERDDPAEARQLVQADQLLALIDRASRPQDLPTRTEARNLLGDEYVKSLNRLADDGIIETRSLPTGRAGANPKHLTRPGQFTESEWQAAEDKSGN